MPIHRTPLFQRAVVHASVLLAFATFLQTSAAQTAMTLGAESAANPAAKVPAVGYRSVFKETSLGVEKDTENWRKANDDVGKFLRGHIDILKSEEQDIDKAMKEPMAKPMTAPGTMQKPAMPETIKPIAAPAHKH